MFFDNNGQSKLPHWVKITLNFVFIANQTWSRKSDFTIYSTFNMNSYTYIYIYIFKHLFSLVFRIH